MDESLQQLDTLFSIAESFEQTMARGLRLMIAPNALGAMGVLFFGFGFLPVSILYYLGVVASLGYTTFSTRNEQRQILDNSIKLS